jgi:hypothetical protein
MMGTEETSEKLDFNSTLTLLIAREEFRTSLYAFWDEVYYDADSN